MIITRLPAHYITNLVVVVVDDHYPPPCTLPAAHRISEPAAPGIYFLPKTKKNG